MSEIARGTDRGFFGHPRGLAVLFFTELWERFSFYGMRALLILYLTASVADGGLQYNAQKAGAIYALYTSLVYLLGLPGGWLADHIFGQRRAILFGGILIAAGHFSLALQSLPFFYGGLGLIVAGTGLLGKEQDCLPDSSVARRRARSGSGHYRRSLVQTVRGTSSRVL